MEAMLVSKECDGEGEINVSLRRGTKTKVVPRLPKSSPTPLSRPGLTNRAPCNCKPPQKEAFAPTLEDDTSNHANVSLARTLPPDHRRKRNAAAAAAAAITGPAKPESLGRKNESTSYDVLEGGTRIP